MENGSPALKHFYPEMTYVNSTHILLVKSNFTVLANVKGLEGQSLHVPGRRRPEILVSSMRFQSQVSIIKDLELQLKRGDLTWLASVQPWKAGALSGSIKN